jgi:hypothetical protein
MVLYIKTNMHFLSYLAHSFLEWENFQTKVVEKIKTHIVVSNSYFENRAVYELIWTNIVERGKPQMTMAYAHFILDT